MAEHRGFWPSGQKLAGVTTLLVTARRQHGTERPEWPELQKSLLIQQAFPPLWPFLPFCTFGFPRSQWPFCSNGHHTVGFKQGFWPFGQKHHGLHGWSPLLSTLVGKTAKTSRSYRTYKNACLFSRRSLRFLRFWRFYPLPSLAYGPRHRMANRGHSAPFGPRPLENKGPFSNRPPIPSAGSSSPRPRGSPSVSCTPERWLTSMLLDKSVQKGADGSLYPSFQRARPSAAASPFQITR